MVNKTILKNGVRILTKAMAHVRSVSMGVWVNVGARDEAVSESGLSHFIEHMIFKGTRKRTAFQIAKEFDAIGGQTNAFTTMETTCYHARVMDAHLETMVDILSDIFLNSVFDAEEVEKERPVIFQEIGMVEDSPEEYVHILSGNAYWGDNGLGQSILGTRENIISFDAKVLKTFFHQYYKPDCIVISAAGNLTHDRFVDRVGPAFESIQIGDALPQRVTPTGCSGVELHTRELEQVHVCLGTKGLSITDPRRYAFSLLNTILGGNMSSRLFQEIRERRGLAYAVYSFISSYVDTGMFGAYVGVDPKRAQNAINLILKEMLKLKKKPVEPDELRHAKEFTKGGLLLASESVDNQMFRLAQNEIHLGYNIPLNEIVDKIESVTEEEILDLAEHLFQRNGLALTLLGPLTDKKSFEDIIA
ncbi:MAG: insulinase family protein [Deltaproteobacteria bacterium]|nr:insulinase family protein [Deltaproteobacteria bacterium]